MQNQHDSRMNRRGFLCITCIQCQASCPSSPLKRSSSSSAPLLARSD
ncbi:MAG: hypothetical protein ACWA5X_01945 [bacterium]